MASNVYGIALTDPLADVNLPAGYALKNTDGIFYSMRWFAVPFLASDHYTINAWGADERKESWLHFDADFQYNAKILHRETVIIVGRSMT